MFGNCKRLFAIVLAAGLLLSGSVPGFSSALSVPVDQCESPQLVFVELSSAPLIEAVNAKSQRAAITSEQGKFMRELTRAGVLAEERFRYETLFNGFSLLVKPGDLAVLEAIPGVKAIYPVFEVPIPDVGTSTGMINAPTVVDELGFDGSGVVVAVIDTGIDYNHPDLGGGWGVRVVDGWDFVGDDYNAQIPGAIPLPDDDPMDPHGHGTHVAGIIGADGVVRGVAPGVDFLALKVFGREGSTTADIIVAALEMAYLKDADIVNMSLGAAFQWPQYPSARAADRLVNKGVMVVVSQGNSGTDGVYAGGAPSVASKALAVASFDNTHSNQRVFLLPDDTPVGYMAMSFSPPLPTEGTSPELVYVGMGNDPADYEGIDVTGKTVLVSRGVMPFAHKVTMAQARGAALVLIHNNGPGNFAGTLGTPGAWIPAASISREHALIILAMMDDGPVCVTWTDQEHPFPSPTAGFISSFSSWGPSPDLTVKPDLGAPGGSIYSTYPLAFGGYATLSGTSMAAPHVAGAAALLLESNPKLKPQAAGNILRATAVPKAYQGLPYLEPVHRQGGGMIDILAAVTTAGVVEPSKVALGAVADETSFSLTVSNLTCGEVTYTLSHIPALLTNAAHGVPPGLYVGGATLSMPAIVTVPAGGEATVEVGVIQPGFPDGFIFSGYVVLTPDIDAPILTVPYLGVAGDYMAAPVLGTAAPYYFPWLAELDESSYYKADEMTIDLSAGEVAYVLYNLCRQARTVRLEVLGDKGRNYGRVYNENYIARSQNPTTFFSFGWTGVDRKGVPVPDGVYTLKLSALKPLGDSDNPDHWDVWVSGPVTVTGSPTAGKGK